MPFRFSEHTTETGLRYLRCDASGPISLDDAKQFEAQIMLPEWRYGLVLTVVAKGTEYSPEARKYFPTLRNDVAALATVVTSPIVRAALNMILRFGRLKDQHPLQMFTSEAEGLAWLETHRDAVGKPGNYA